MKKILLSSLILICILNISKLSFTYEYLRIENNQNTIKFNFMLRKDGEATNMPPYPKAARDLTDNEKSAIGKMAYYWGDLLNNSKYIDIRDKKTGEFLINIFAINSNSMNATGIIHNVDDPYITYPVTQYVLLDRWGMDTSQLLIDEEKGPFSLGGPCAGDDQNCFTAHGTIVLEDNTSHNPAQRYTYVANRNQNAMPGNLESILIHEMTHVFGFDAMTPYFRMVSGNDPGAEMYGPNPMGYLIQGPWLTPLVEKIEIDVFDRNYKVGRENLAKARTIIDEVIKNAYEGKYDIDFIKILGVEMDIEGIKWINYTYLDRYGREQVGSFFPQELEKYRSNIEEYAYIYTQEAVLEGNLLFYGNNSMKKYGAIPLVRTKEGGTHVDTMNTLMSHKFFRNYAGLMDIEIQILNDIGVFTNNTTGKIIGYTKKQEISNFYNSMIPNVSASPYSIGLHIYNERPNEVFKYTIPYSSRDNIYVGGPGSVGLRIDGQSRTLIFGSISAGGERGTGVLVAYGHDSNLYILGSSEISATGPEGIGVAFDIGVNLVDMNYTLDGYGDLAQFSHFRVRDSVPAEARDEFTQAVEYLNGPLVNEFYLINGSIKGEKAAIYIGGNSHVGQIAITGGVIYGPGIYGRTIYGSSIYGRIISDYYYESQARSTLLSFGIRHKAGIDLGLDHAYSYASAGILPTTNSIGIILYPGSDPRADHGFRFIIRDDILGYGAPVTDDGYLGRYSGRGLFDMELVGGVTTLLHGASVKVNSFTMMPNAVLLTTANLEKNLYPTITAKAFDFREHSHVGLDESFMFGGNNLPAGSEYTVLRLEHTGGSSLFVNDSTAFAELARDYRLDIPGIIPAPKGTVSVGAYDYPASIRWSDDRKTLLLKIEGAPAVNVEHSGMQAEESLRQVANIGGYMTSGNVFTHLVPNEAAYSHVLQAPRPVQPPHIRQAPGFMRPNGERSAPSSGEDGDRLWSLWVSPWYSYNRHETREGTIGYTVKAPGLTLGVERSLIDGSALVGVAVGAAMPEVDGDYISLEAHTVSATAYAAAILPFEVDLSAVVSYSVSRYDQDRVSEGSHYFAGYHGKGVSAAAMAGRRFQLSRQFAVRPYARMDYIHNDIEPYTELGQGPQARAMSRNSSDLWQSELGADLIFSAENGITFTGRLGWTRHFNDTLEFDGYYLSDQPSPSLFRVSSVQFDKNALVYGLDVKFPVAESVDIRFSYDGSVSTHDSSHTGALTGIFSF